MSEQLFPDDPSVPPSVAHRHEFFVSQNYPGKLVPWSAPRAPDLTANESAYTVGRMRACRYCGSLHPSDLAHALAHGARLHWADWKYGWPHKAYVEGVPNPFAGAAEARISQSTKPSQEEIDAGMWLEKLAYYLTTTGDPVYWWHRVAEARPLVEGKFYTVHLQDATVAERAVIQAAMGLEFRFTSNGNAQWVKGTRSMAQALAEHPLPTHGRTP